MAPVAIVFGVLLTVLGCGMFAYTGMDFQKFTPLIPAFFGLPLIGLGIAALNEARRKHAMHAAAMLGLIGFAIPAGMVIVGLAQGKEFDLAKQEQAVMAVICLIFVAWCVKSFIDVRAARKQREAAAGSQS